MNKKIIAAKVHSMVDKKFIYVSDKKQYMVNEHWTSHAEEVLQGDDFKDDCDGFACTCAELLIREGVDRSEVSVIYCETETGEAHLVCGIVAESSTYILENRYNYVYDWKSRPGYKWFYFMKFDDVGQWFKVKNTSGNGPLHSRR